MNKKTFYFLILSLWGGYRLLAQEEVFSCCGTIEKTDEEMELLPWYGNNGYFEQLRDSAQYLFSSEAAVQERLGSPCPDIDGAYLIPVRLWVYRESDNDPGMPDDLDLQIMIDRLNFLYQSNGLNVRFFMVCPQYETNTEMTDATNWDAFWNTFGGANTDADAINVHIVKHLVDASGVYNSFADLIVVDRSVYTSLDGVSTLAHEIGHYFGLEHPHRNATKGTCRAECVSRTRNFPWYCFKTGRICEKNGDALSDTPADPELRTGEPPVSKVDANCNYNWGEDDNFGDSYVPDETNIMSYAPRPCRTAFSPMQASVMGNSMIYIRTIFQVVDINETDPDIYEPDDSDFPEVPRLIALGETQCHSFYDMLSCQDPADWLILSLNQGVLGSYKIEVDDVLNASNPVAEIKVWNIGANGMRSTVVSTTTSTNGTIRAWSFPCSVSGNNLLVEVVRKSDVTEGKYTITFTSSNPLSISGNNALCASASYSVEGPPNGSNIDWTSSPSITLGNTTGTTVTVQSFTASAIDYWVEASISWGGCTQKIRKTLTYVGGAGIPNFTIVEETPPCFPLGLGHYTISNPTDGVTYSWSCQGNPCAYIHSSDNGEDASIKPKSEGYMTLTVTATDPCGNNLTKTFEAFIEGCGGQIENIIVTPNPSATSIVNVTIQDSYETEGIYSIFITNQMSELKLQSTVSTKEFSLNLGEFQNGIYFIHVYREDTSDSASFIMNR